MAWLLIAGAVALLVVAIYACLVVAGEVDRREEAYWAQQEREQGKR